MVRLMKPTPPRGPNEPPHLPPDPLPRKNRRGRGVNLNWRQEFLAHYQRHGGFYAAAEYAGVNSSTVYDEMHRNADFKQQADEARQLFADSQERQLQALGEQGNVVGPIVLLKKHRPAEYIEKNLSITASFSAELDPQQGQQLLQAMLQNLTPESVKALEAKTEP